VEETEQLRIALRAAELELQSSVSGVESFWLPCYRGHDFGDVNLKVLGAYYKGQNRGSFLSEQ